MLTKAQRKNAARTRRRQRAAEQQAQQHADSLSKADTLDRFLGCHGQFSNLLMHAQACASRGGLNASGVAYIVNRDAAGIDKGVFRPGLDEGFVAAMIQSKQRSGHYRGHGTIVGVYVDNRDAIMMQYMEGSRWMSFLCYVSDPTNIHHDDHFFTDGHQG